MQLVLMVKLLPKNSFLYLLRWPGPYLLFQIILCFWLKLGKVILTIQQLLILLSPLFKDYIWSHCDFWCYYLECFWNNCYQIYIHFYLTAFLHNSKFIETLINQFHKTFCHYFIHQKHISPISPCRICKELTKIIRISRLGNEASKFQFS